MKKDIVIIGGGPAGMIAAVTAKSNYPEKSVIFIRRETKTLVPCGIPYTFDVLGGVEKNLVPDKPFLDNGIEIFIDVVESVDCDNKKIFVKEAGEIEYEKLIFATGSEPYNPAWLKGHDLENVFLIKKNHVYLADVLSKVKSMKKIAVIGAGFIGVEVAEELANSGKEVYLIEKLPSILGVAFDQEIVSDIHEELKNKSVNILTGNGIKEISGNGKVESVILENEESIQVDAVILAMGYVSNSKLAEEAGVLIGKKGSIWTDNYMRTNTDDVFAVGDCAERRHFISKRPCNIMLASTATSEARMAGSNLYNLNNLKSFSGTISVFSTKVGGKIIGSAGIIESEAKLEGIDYVTGEFECPDKHPGTLPGAVKQRVKLLASKNSGVIIGGQIAGGDSSAELINVIGMIIINKMTAYDVFVSQIGTHPLTTAAPTKYPLVKAAEMLLKKLAK